MADTKGLTLNHSYLGIRIIPSEKLAFEGLNRGRGSSTGMGILMDLVAIVFMAVISTRIVVVGVSVSHLPRGRNIPGQLVTYMAQPHLRGDS